MGRTKRLRRLAAGGIAAAVIGVLVIGGLYARGFWDDSRAVHIKPREIEDSTLAIGTHLIHLSALNDSLYEIAEKSAEESGQNQIFYKSELGEGAWFDISSAYSLNDITLGGAPVTDEEMEALFFTHHTMSDGVTYDLRTGEAVNIFDIRDPYDLESMEELSPLKLYYDQLLEIQGESDTTRRIDTFWQTPVSGDEGPAAVRDNEERLYGLQGYLDTLNAREADSRETGKVTSVMEAVDAARRHAVFEVVEYELERYLNEELGQPPPPPAAEEEEGSEENGGSGEAGDSGGSGEEEDSGGTGIDPETFDQDLLSAVSESLGNVKNSLIDCEGRMLSEGQTVMSRAEYQYSNDLINHAKAGNSASCDQDVERLLLLDNISNDVISDRPKELSLLGGTLIGEASSRYREALGQGESAEYKAQAAKNAPQAVLNRFINEGVGEIDARRGELEFLLEAECLRLDPASGMEFLDSWIDRVSGFADLIPDDAFQSGAADSVDAFANYLTNKRRALEMASGGNRMDELNAEKDDLQTQRLSALDKNDLAGAKALAEKISDVEEEIRALEAESAARLGALQDQISALEAAGDLGGAAAAKAELANLEKSLSDGSLGSLITQLKRDALDAIAAGEGGPAGEAGTGEGGGAEAAAGALLAQDAVDALSELLPASPKLVLPAMQEIYHELLLSGGDQGLIDRLEQAILENPAALREDLSASTLRSMVDGFDGGAVSKLLAVELYYQETGSRDALQLISALARKEAGVGNPMVFERIQDSAGEYLPLTAVQAVTGWRFVWEKNTSLGVLARGKEYYGFTLYSIRVVRDPDEKQTELMDRMAKNKTGIHIPEEYAEARFGVQAYYLSGTTLGCAYDSGTMAEARELLALLLAA